MGSSPSFQFYVKQWLGDDNVLLMDWDARGMHVHLMCISWQQDEPGTLPDDERALRRWLGDPKPSIWARVWPQILRAWTREDGRLIQEGLRRAFERASRFSSSRSDNARSGWKKRNAPAAGGREGGPERTADASALQVQCTADANRSSGCIDPHHALQSSVFSLRSAETPPTPPGGGAPRPAVMAWVEAELAKRRAEHERSVAEFPNLPPWTEEHDAATRRDLLKRHACAACGRFAHAGKTCAQAARLERREAQARAR